MKMTIRLSRLTWLPIATTLLLFGCPAGAQSADGVCASDADCASGQTCQKGMYVNPCAVPPVAPGEEPVDTPACDSTPQEAETGRCITPPTPCSSDADCEEYLSCVATSDGVCWMDSNGNTGCDEPDPNAPKYCGVASVACDSNSECPREFECVETPTACPAIDCAEDAPDCKIACEPSGVHACQPKKIECADDSACPSDWRCVGNVIETCSGGGSGTGGGVDGAPGEPGTSTPSDPGAPAPTTGPAGDSEDLPAPDVPEERICTTQAAIGYCQPKAYGETGSATGGDVAYEDGGLTGSDDDAAPGAEPPRDSSAETLSAGGGGCSVAYSQTSPAGWALGLLLLAPLARRKRALTVRS